VNNYVEYGKRIVCLGDNQHHHLVYLVLPEGWILLSQPQGVPYINKVLETFFASPRDLEDPSKLVKYIEEVSYLFKGPHREALSNTFLERSERTVPSYAGKTERVLDLWLGGREKNPKALRSLCSDPIVRLQGDSFEIKCNIITGLGSVEEWTLEGKLGKTVTLTDIAVSQIREEETFFYPLVPND
jgi:hypothetical protein